MIYKNGATIKSYVGDGIPVNIYKGETKVAGWQYSEKTGTDLTFSSTYNDTASLLING